MIFPRRIPTDGTNIPRLLHYLSFMLILTTFAFVETILTKLLVESDAPLWTQGLLKQLRSNNCVKYFVYSPFSDVKPEPTTQSIDNIDENDAEPAEEQKILPAEPKEDWKIFCCLIDRILFIAFGFSYKFFNGFY